MNSKKVILDNGLKLLVIPVSGMESAAVAVWVKTGSRYETEKTSGLSHFMEHMVFKGSKKRPSAKAISEIVDSFGGEFNAGTSKEWTNFYIKGRNTYLPVIFDVLSDMVLNPLLKSDEIEREKGVICEEIAMYEDTPIAKINDLFENVVYRGSKLAWDISGSQKSVRGINRSDFINFRKKFYYPENMMITVAGGVRVNEIIDLAKKSFHQLAATKKTFTKPQDKLQQSSPRLLLKKKTTDQTHLILGFKGSEFGAPLRYAEAILSTVLGGGMSSRLFLEVRERRGLAYAIKTSSDHEMDNGYLATYAGVKTEKVSEAISVILKTQYELSGNRKPISKKELTKAKEFLKGHMALSLEDTHSVNDFFGLEELYLDETRTPEEVFKMVDKVSLTEVMDVAKNYFKPEKLNLAVIGPFEDKKRFEKLLK